MEVNRKENQFLLLKFFSEEEHMIEFLNGSLYMTPRENFQNIELSSGQQDYDEGKSLISKGYKPVFIMKDGKCYFRLEEVEEENAYFSYSSVKDRKKVIFCMYSLEFDIDNGEYIKVPKQMIDEFGPYCAVVLTPYAYFDRIKATPDTEGLNIYMGHVKYVEQSESPKIYDWRPFIKEIRYQYQSEFRIVLESDSEVPVKLQLSSDTNCLMVGNLSESILNGFYLINGNICIQVDWIYNQGKLSRLT